MLRLVLKRIWGDVVPLSEHLEAWLGFWAINTQRSYRRSLERFQDSLGGVSLLNATELHCTRWATRVRKEISPWSARHQILALKSAYDYLLRNKLVKENHWGRILDSMPRAKPGEQRPTKLVPFDQVLRIISAPSSVTTDGVRARAAFAVFFFCGLRSSELFELRIGSVKTTDSGAMYLLLSKTKSQKFQKVAVPDTAAEYLDRLRELRDREGAKPDAYLFTKFTEGRSVGKLTRAILRNSWAYYTRACGVEGAGMHAARATLITKLLSDGVSYREVQEVSRHSSIQMLEVYDKRRFEIEEQANRKIKF